MRASVEYVLDSQFISRVITGGKLTVVWGVGPTTDDPNVEDSREELWID